MSFGQHSKSWNSPHRSRLRHRALALLLGAVVVVTVLGAALALQRVSPGASSILTLDAATLFDLHHVWTIHLKFTPDQWEAMEPKGGFGPFGGGPFGGPPRGGGGPGPFGPPGRTPGQGPGGPGGPPGGFGPAMFIAPTFLSQGDLDHDGRLSRGEFGKLAEKWFSAWDTNKTGRLDVTKIRAGLNATLGSPRGMGGPPGPGGPNGPGRPAGPGGPGGRGPGLMLQGPEGKRNGIASAMGIEFTYVHADLDFEGQPFKDVAVRFKGNGTFLESRASLKRSLKIELNKYVKGQKLAGQVKLNLHNNVTDASWMNEPLSYRLYRDAGVPAPRTSYARVYLTVPGKYDHQYVGLYSLIEEVDKNFVGEHFGTRRGALFKPVTPFLFSDLGPDWAKYKQTYDPKTHLFDDQIQQVIDFCRLVSHADDAQFATRLGDFIDLEEFARFMAVMVWLSDMDGILGPGQNLYVYLHPKSQLLEFIPWDQDHSFGQFPMRGTQEQRENLSILKPWDGENRFLERVFKVEAFKKLYLARLTEFSETICRPERFARQVDEVTSVIRPAVQEEDTVKLGRFDKAVAGEILQGRGFGPFGGGPGITPIKPFAIVRTASVRDQVAGKSAGQTVGSFGFFGGGRPGGRPGGPGGPDGFGPGMFLGGIFLDALDQDKDSVVTHEEFVQGFAKWFDAWNTDHSGVLTEDQLRAGINQDLSPFRGGPPPGFPRPRPGDGEP